MEIIKNNYTNINIDDYPNKIFDQNQSISHNSVNAHNYDIYNTVKWHNGFRNWMWKIFLSKRISNK